MMSEITWRDYYKQRGIPVRTGKDKRGWVLIDGNGELVADEFGEAFAYGTQAEAERSMRGFAIIG